jgi:biotin carboxyl carrier protein
MHLTTYAQFRDSGTGRRSRDITLKKRIIVDGKTYEVEYDNPEESSFSPSNVDPVQSLVLPTPPDPRVPAQSNVDESKVFRSPVDGIVTRINVETGKQVNPGDILLVVEAMKMENNVTTHATASITSIKVKAGDAVKAGQVLVEFE